MRKPRQVKKSATVENASQVKSQIEKLKDIEEIGYDMGNMTYENFKKTQNLASLKASVSACRLSMQAIRDQIRYKAS